MKEGQAASDDDKLFAEALVEIRAGLKMLRPWCEETDRTLQRIERAATKSLEEIGAARKDLTTAYERIDRIDTKLDGVLELAKSAYDMAVDLKERKEGKGGDADQARMAVEA